MAGNDSTPAGMRSVRDEVVDYLNTEERLLAYLRAAMLESGDDPTLMATALQNVEVARARLHRMGPLRAKRSP